MTSLTTDAAGTMGTAASALSASWPTADGGTVCRPAHLPGLPRKNTALDGVPVTPQGGGQDALERLLDELRAGGGFDLTDYSRPCLARRVAERMKQVELGSMDAYVQFLRDHPAEGDALCRTVWINVTSFFRDPSVWEHLRTQIIPELLARQRDAAPLRIWSAGCASGQEAYSLAMLVAEAFDQSGSAPDTLGRRVEILATDVDEDALAQARQGIYPERALAAVPFPLREKHFEPAAGGGRVRGALRRMVRFQYHNLLCERPRGVFDLIVCRNTLIYFRPESQGHVLARLRRSLAADGFLLLGQSEMPIFQDRDRTLADRFTPVHLRARLYRKSWA